MVLAVCIDDCNGMMFNKRRVSSDKAVIQDIIQNLIFDTIAIDPYSLPLFKEYEQRIAVTNDCLAPGNPVCFAEFGDFLNVKEDIQTLIVYKWNRRYPSDIKFPMDVFKSFLKLKSTEEFEGYSHECITKEVYVR